MLFNNKKYAIRKLTMGVASIAIGVITWGAGGFLIPSITQNSYVAHASCNTNGAKYFLNHYDEYETVYEVDSTLAKGEHKVSKQGGESTQLFGINEEPCSWKEPYSAFGDNEEMFHKPYEVIINNRDKGKELEHIGLELFKTREQSESDGNLTPEESQEISNKEQEYLLKNDEYYKKLSTDKFFVETKTHKKIELNSDENVTEPIYKEDGTVVIPSHTISKKYKNFKDRFNEYKIYKINKDYFEKDDEYISAVEKKNSDEYRLYKEYVVENPKIIKVGNVEKNIISRTAIETDYIANNNMDYGTRETTSKGKEGLVESVTTYEVNRNNGDLSNPTTVENNIPMEKAIVQVGTKEKVSYLKKNNDVIKTVTTYNLNNKTGEVTANNNETIYVENGVKDKVVYRKEGNNIVKETTTYNVNPSTGAVTEIGTTKETISEDGAKDKVETEIIPKTTKYEMDENLDYGKQEVKNDGSDGIKTTIITYDVIPESGELVGHRGEPKIELPKYKVITVGVKPTINIIKRDNKQIKQTTSYIVNENTGELTSNITEEIIGDVKPKTSNGTEAPLTYEIPEYKDTLLTNTPVDDNGEFILPPTVETPEYTGTITNNTPVDDDGNLILPPTYNKEEYKLPIATNNPVDNDGNIILPPVVNVPEYKDTIVNEEQKYNTEKSLQSVIENKELDNEQNSKTDNKQDLTNQNENTTEANNEIVQKQTLPKTNALHSTAYVLGLLLSTVGFKRNKKD